MFWPFSDIKSFRKQYFYLVVPGRWGVVQPCEWTIPQTFLQFIRAFFHWSLYIPVWVRLNKDSISQWKFLDRWIKDRRHWSTGSWSLVGRTSSRSWSQMLSQNFVSSILVILVWVIFSFKAFIDFNFDFALLLESFV